MFYHLALQLQDHLSLCNVVHYVSFRAIAALLTSLFLSLVFGQKFIDFSRRTFQSKVRPYSRKSSIKKQHSCHGRTIYFNGRAIKHSVVVRFD